MDVKNSLQELRRPVSLGTAFLQHVLEVKILATVSLIVQREAQM
jgi:hypothetical protein